MKYIFNNEIVTYIGEVAVHNMPGTPEVHNLYKSKNSHFTLSINDALNLTKPISEYPAINSLTDIQKIEQIIGVIEMHFGKRNKWLTKSRKRDFVYARHLLFWAAKTTTSQTLMAISDNFGFDHSTMIHAIKNVISLIETGNQSITECAVEIASTLSDSGDESLNAFILDIKSKSIFINKQKS